MRRTTLLLVAIAAFAAACGGGLNSRWNGSGELAESRFFDLVLNLKDLQHPTAEFQFRRSTGQDIKVCRLVQNERHVEFVMDPGAPDASCDALQNPLTFVGDYGRDVLTGQVLDAGGRRVGVFRAFRVEE